MNLIARLKQIIIKHHVAIIAGSIAFIAGYTACWFFRSSYTSIASTQLARYGAGTWIVKVDGDPLGKDCLDRRVELYKEYLAPADAQSDPLLHDKMLRKMIDNYIVLKAAQRSRVFATNRAQEYLWLFLEEAMVNYYLDTLVRVKSGGGITLADSEVEDFYTKNRELFDSRKIAKKDALEHIRRQMQGINTKMSREYGPLARRVELGRLKEGKKIQINKEILSSETRNAR